MKLPTRFIIHRYGKLVRKGKYRELSKAIVSARLPITTQKYLAMTLLYSTIFGAIGVVLGAILFYEFFTFHYVLPYLLRLSPEFVLEHIRILQFFHIFLGSLIIGALTFKLAQYIILSYPVFVANKRRNEINVYLPHAINMMFGMAVGGVRVYDIFKCMAEARAICGELSREFKIIVDLVENFKHDLFESMRFVRDTTPSEKLASFLDDLIFIMSGGGKLVEFLKGKSEELLEEQETHFDAYIDFLGIMAEVYLSIFVLLPLFLLIVLVVMQLIGENVISLYRTAIFLVLPFATIAFIYLLKSSLPTPRVNLDELLEEYECPVVWVEGRGRSFEVNSLKRVLKRIGGVMLYPFKERCLHTVRLEMLSFHFFLIALVTFLVSSRFMSLERSCIVTVSAVAIPLIVLVEFRNRRIRKMEERIPSMFRELSVLNEAGLNILEALKVLSTSEVGLLSREIAIVRRRIEWGTTVHKAFNVLAKRIKSDVISKVIPIVSKSLEISPTFKDAFLTVANYADAEVRFSRRIRNYMFTYVVITYLAIFIFLFIVYIVITSFLSAFSINVTRMGNIAFSLNLKTVEEVFFQISLLVGLLSGIIAGVIGEGRVEAGLKHSYVFLMATYIVFRILLGR